MYLGRKPIFESQWSKLDHLTVLFIDIENHLEFARNGFVFVSMVHE